jgi:hypothetical protein
MMVRASEPPMKYRRAAAGFFHTLDFTASLSSKNSVSYNRRRVMALIVPYGTIMSQGKKRPLTSFQIRAARALVKWSAEDLAGHSSVSLRTIRRAELAERATSMTAPNDSAIRSAFEAAGIEFIDENGGGPGVRLRKRHHKKS